MRFRSANPVYKNLEVAASYEDACSYSGVTVKTSFLLALAAVVAVFIGSGLLSTGEVPGFGTLILAIIVGFISIIVVMRSTTYAPVFAVVYAIAEGYVLGFISALYMSVYGDSIVPTALLATLGVFTGMLFLYSTGIIRVGSTFRKFMYAALIGLLISSLLFMVFAMFGGMSGELGYSIYLVIIVAAVLIASFYLLIDFDNITTFVNQGAAREYEWQLSVGLLVTVIWLYLELLRLIAVLSRRR